MANGSDDELDWQRICRLSLDPFLVISTLGPEYPILEVSEGYLRVTGLRREHLVGRPSLEIVGGGSDLRSAAVSELRAALQGSGGSDGERREAWGSNVRIAGRGGSGPAVLHRVGDVGSGTRRHVWSSLQRRDEEVFQAAPVAIALLHGPEHVFGLSNGEYSKVMGDGDMVGRPAREVLPRWAAPLLSELDRVRRGDAPALHIPLTKEERGKRGQRCVYHYSASVLPFHDSSGNVEGEAVFAFDVTAYVQSQRKDRFLAVLGHELRNPLAPIQTVAEFLRMDGIQNEPGRLERLAGVVERQVRQLTRIVDDLLDISRINEGRLQLKFALASVADIVDAAIDTCQRPIDGRRQSLYVQRPPSSVSVRVDVGRFTQCLVNLLSNASRYTDADGEIHLVVHAQGRWLEVAVSDTGRGIDPSFLPMIFESFSRADWTADAEQQGGLGLGLSLVRRIVEMHGGDVEAHSPGLGQGSRFVLRAPVIAEHKSAEEHVGANEDRLDSAQ